MKKTFSNQFFVSFTKWVVTSILYLNSNIRFSERTFFKIRNKRNTPHYQKPNKVCVRVPRLSLSDKFIISSLWTNGVGGRLYISTLWSRPCWKDYKLQAVNTEFYQPTDVEMSVTSITMSSLLAERGLYEVNNDGSFKWFGVKQDWIMMTCFYRRALWNVFWRFGLTKQTNPSCAPYCTLYILGFLRTLGEDLFSFICC